MLRFHHAPGFQRQGLDLRVARAAKLEMGDFATPAAMHLARLARMKPDDIAQAIASHFPTTDYLASVETVKGYINFRLADGWLQSQVDDILAQGDRFGQLNICEGQRAQVECVSANPTGPITVGRIRGGVIGDTQARILRAVARRKEEVLIGGPEVFTVYLKRIFPTLLSAFVRSHPVRFRNRLRRLLSFRRDEHDA
jgi:arginyl-tRNA synthetase